MLNLRDNLTPSANPYLSAPEPSLAQAYDTLDVAGSNSLRRGWVSADYGSRVGDLSNEALAAGLRGDGLRQAYLTQLARDEAQRAQLWAPTTRNFTDIDSPSTALDWAGGALGNLRSSVGPALGGLAGAGVGAAAGYLLKNPALGARIGAGLGSAYPAYQMERGETVAGAMLDPNNTATLQDIDRTGMAKGGVNALLEAAVPFGVATSLAGMGRRVAAGEAKRHLGKEVAKDAGTEFLTEGAQSLTGQAAENHLQGKPLGELDYKQAFNEGMAGAVAGGGMGLIGATGDLAHSQLAGAKDTAGELKRDPLGTVLDAGVDLARKAGELKVRAETYLDNREQLKAGKTQEEIDRAVFDDLAGQPQRSAADSVRADETGLSDSELVRRRKDEARAAGWDESSGHGWLEHSRTQRDEAAVKAAHDEADEALRAIDGGTKKSMMQADGSRAPSVADILLKEGYSEKLINAATSQGIRDADLKKVHSLLHWGQNIGFQSRQEEAVPHIVKMFGDKAPKMFRKAYEAGVSEGLFPRDDATADVVQAKLARETESVKMLGDVLVANLTPTARSMLAEHGAAGSASYKQALTKLIGEVRRVVSAGGAGGNVKQASGQRSAKDDHVMRVLFGTDAKNVSAVVDAFYSPEQARDNGGRVAKAAPGSDEQSESLNVENETGLGDEKSLPSARSDHFKGDSGFFNLKNAEDKASFEALKTSTTAAKGTEDRVRRDGTTLGIIEHALEKAEQERGHALTPASRDKITRDLVHQLVPSLERLKAPPKHAMAVTRKDYEQRKAAYDREVAAHARRLNAQHVALRVTETEMEKPALEFSDADVAEVKLARDLRDPKNNVQRGTLLLQRVDSKGEVLKEPFITSAPALMRLMYQRQEREGFVDTKEGGSAYSKHDMLMDALTSLATREGFSGKLGYPSPSGDPVWLEQGQDFPDHLTVDTGNDLKKKPRRTYGEIKAAGKAQRAVGEVWDGDPGNFKVVAGREEGRVGQGTLADETPERLPPRDEHGMPVGTDDTMIGASFTGRQVAVQAGRTEAGPVAGKSVLSEQELANLRTKHGVRAPFSIRAQAELAEVYKGGVKALSAKQTNALDAALQMFPALRGAIGNIRTVAVVVKEGVLPVDTATGKSSVAALVKVTDGFAVLMSPELLAHSDKVRIAANFSHEVGHSLESRVDLNLFKADGELAQEARKVKNADLAKRLAYPLSDARGQDFASEFHAQVFRLFIVKPELLQSEMPKTYAKLEEFHGEERVRSANGASHTGSSSGQLGGAGERRGPNDRPLATGGVAAAEGARGGRSAGAQQLQAYLDQHASKNSVWAGAARRALAAGDEKQIAGALAAARKQFGELGDTPANRPSGNTGVDANGVKRSTERAAAQQASDEAVAKASEHLTKTLGGNIQADFIKTFADGSSGSWTPGATKNVITIALNGDVMGTAFHESFHEFLDVLRKHGGEQVVAQIRRAATNKLMLAQLDRLLDGHPEAQAQLRADPDEAAAFMYQFWAQGKLKVGGETRSAFQRIKDYLAKVLGLVSDEVRRMELDEQQVRDIMLAFNDGAVADASKRQLVVEALNKSAEAHEAALRNVGRALGPLQAQAAQLVFSAEAMLEGTKNPYLQNLSTLFHQTAGKAMGSSQSYMDGVREQTNRYMNKLEDVLNQYDAADLELARHGLSVEKRPTAQAAGKAYDEIKGFFAEMATYLESKDVRRLDVVNGKPTWVKINFRKHYWPQVWDMDVVQKNLDGLREDLMKHHGDVLAKIAAEANAEVKRGKGAGKDTASGDALDTGSGATITPIMIADAIIVRLQNTGGQADINEDMSDMGITPMASAVNKRTLDWLDGEVFDKYKSKDIARIMTTYTVNMTKRAEYQSRFGYDGTEIRDAMDKAVLDEVGGTALVSDAVDDLPGAIEAWNKAAAAWHDEHGDEAYPVAYPTLRSVGLKKHRAAAGVEKADKDHRDALLKLEQAFKAVSAMEGTLGRDISPNFRNFSSWAVTYQNFTKLSTMLFTSFQDVMGIVANGGELGDAWNAFVSGIKEIKNSWKNEKDPSKAMQRAEFWGTVDAMALQDALGQTYGSSFMTGNAKRWSDKFFKWTGAEGWNRGVRAVATQVAERTILDWKQNGIDRSDKAAVARLERLYGARAKVEDIKVAADGSLDINDLANQHAVTRWVLDAVPVTSAAHRPIWGSDPHFQMFIQFKNYTYSFHRILLKGAVEQAKLGNYRPAMVLAVGYLPIAIAGGAIKEMLIPGDEPAWMKGGLDGYLSYGFTKAGVLGVPQMYVQNLYDLDPAATFGPSVDQLQNLLSVPLLESRTALGEALGALPAGNLLRRAA